MAKGKPSSVKQKANSAKYPKPPVDSIQLKASAGEIIKENMIAYGEDVIEDRAVPDYRDGLKPVQRRILYTMRSDIKLSHTGPTKKCAAVVGGVIGSYHPHGDASIYSAMVKLYHQRYRLVMPRGNFGSELETESAYRYTEAKLTPIQQDIFADMDVMERVPNFDSSTTEPLVINTRVPLLLLNGCSGIAVGLSVDIPSHNIKEICDALIYVAKSPNEATVEGIMDFVSGPDFRNGGSLISKKSEVAELYRNGTGRLEFKCDYKLGQDDEGRTTIDVIGFPDEAFSLAGFITACEKLRVAGNVYAVEADYIDSRFGEKSIDGKPLRTHTVKITVSNRKGLDAVMKKLIVRKTYQFYTTKRSPEGISLKTYNMLQIMKQWIRWRKGEEKKVLELELTRTEKTLWNETTRLIAMQPKHIDIIAEALKQNKIEFEDYLVKFMGITQEQSKFISELQIKSLRKANIPEQEKKIAGIKDHIDKIKDDLLHITRVVIKHLKALSVYFDDRRTKVGGKAQSTANIKIERTGDPTVMMASADGKLFTNVTDKGTSSVDTLAVGSYEGCVILDASGLTKLLSNTECEGKAGPAYNRIVGIAPQEASHIIGIGKNGFGIKTGMQQRRSEFQIIKGTELIYGNAVNDTSKVLIWGKSEDEFACLPANKISETRSNVAGKKLVNFKPKKALVLHQGQSLCSADGSSVSAQRAGEFYREKLYVVDTRNIVFFKSGKRKFMDANSAKKMLSGKDVKAVFPVTLPQ